MKKIVVVMICIYSLGCASLSDYGYPDLITRQIYVKNHPNLSQQIKADILKRVVRIGMTKEQFLIVWRPPTKINRTVTKYGVHEQWVYGGCNPSSCNYKFFYFENGILTSWQD